MSQQPVDTLARVLLSVMENDNIPYSQMSSALRKRAKSLFDTGALVVSRKGAGNSISVHNKDALNAFIAATYPGGMLLSDVEGEGSRTRGVRMFGNSKRTGPMELVVVVFRARTSDAAHLTGTVDGLPFGSFLLSDTSGASFDGRVAIVENHEFFARFDWIANGFDTVILSSGKAPARLLDWLASDSMWNASFTHFGDYDPVGLDEFSRLHARLGERIQFYIPDNIEPLFAFCRAELLIDSGKLMSRLGQHRHPAIQRIMGLMREYGGGLEQESLLFSHRE